MSFLKPILILVLSVASLSASAGVREEVLPAGSKKLIVLGNRELIVSCEGKEKADNTIKAQVDCVCLLEQPDGYFDGKADASVNMVRRVTFSNGSLKQQTLGRFSVKSYFRSTGGDYEKSVGMTVTDCQNEIKAQAVCQNVPVINLGN